MSVYSRSTAVRTVLTRSRTVQTRRAGAWKKRPSCGSPVGEDIAISLQSFQRGGVSRLCRRFDWLDGASNLKTQRTRKFHNEHKEFGVKALACHGPYVC